jgi:hypothetical protein
MKLWKYENIKSYVLSFHIVTNWDDFGQMFWVFLSLLIFFLKQGICYKILLFEETFFAKWRKFTTNKFIGCNIPSTRGMSQIWLKVRKDMKNILQSCVVSVTYHNSFLNFAKFLFFPLNIWQILCLFQKHPLSNHSH